MRKNKAQGFTLIELLIVIAIIAILAAVLIPNLLAARKRANDTTVTAYLNDIAKFEEMYQLDNNAYTSKLSDLQALGLKKQPANTDIKNISATANDYCWKGRHTGGTKWFTVDPENGVQKSTVDATNATGPTSCP